MISLDDHSHAFTIPWLCLLACLLASVICSVPVGEGMGTKENVFSVFATLPYVGMPTARYSAEYTID